MLEVEETEGVEGAVVEAVEEEVEVEEAIAVVVVVEVEGYEAALVVSSVNSFFCDSVMTLRKSSHM